MEESVIVSENQKFISLESLKEKGLSLYRINQLVENGNLKKINKRMYENLAYTGEESDFYYAHAYIPNGVVCLLSAAVYYGLSSYRPDTVDVAIPNKSRVSTLPEWPDLKLYYFSKNRYELGITTVIEGKNVFLIFDIEKTVADVVSYRNKVGIEETKEILTKYLQRHDRNINRLVYYAEVLKCDAVLKHYLEVLV